MEKEEGDLIEKFGGEKIQNFKEIINNLYFKRGIIPFHKKLDIFLKACSDKKETVIVLGFNPISDIHFGHLLVFNLAKFFQKEYNSKVLIIIPNEEAYLIDKNNSFEYFLKKSRDLAKQIISCGFNKKRTYFIIDSICPSLYNLAFKFSKNINLTTINAIYGFKNENSIGTFFLPIVQSAQILSPQVIFKNISATLIPIGINEDAHLRLCRDIALKNNLTKPSIVYIDYLPGLDGSRMTRKKPESAIFILESKESITRKISKTLTGGMITKEEQIKMGGNVNKCIVYRYLSLYPSIDAEKLKAECLAGNVMCYECKTRLAKVIYSELSKYQKERRKISTKLLNKMIIKTLEIKQS